MKDSKASHHLREICETYEKQAADLKILRNKVRDLTRQRDQATARARELRVQVAKYQSALAEERAKPKAKPSAWEGGSRTHFMDQVMNSVFAQPACLTASVQEG